MPHSASDEYHSFYVLFNDIDILPENSVKIYRDSMS
jgi:hypothetical protein